jgi:hypothetical protein
VPVFCWNFAPHSRQVAVAEVLISGPFSAPAISLVRKAE